MPVCVYHNGDSVAIEKAKQTASALPDRSSAPLWRMDLSAFGASLAAAAPPSGLSRALSALWLDAKGDWDGAHEAAQADEGGPGDWVHAYLHRKEGDAGNAAYWYRRACKPVCLTSIEEEWAAIAEALLQLSAA